MTYQDNNVLEGDNLGLENWQKIFNRRSSDIFADNYSDYLINSHLLKFADFDTWSYAKPEEILQNCFLVGNTSLIINGVLVKTHKPNLIFEKVRQSLPEDAYFAFNVITAENKKNKLKDQLHPILFQIYYPFYFLFRRLLPKAKALKKIASLYPLSVDMSKSELIGRLVYKGFTVVDLVESEQKTLFIAKVNLISNPSEISPEPCEGLLFNMLRLGKNGKKIVFYKFRSMHPYAEYVQEYLLKTNGLDVGGKFKNDFRVSVAGRLIRKYWIDELPMLFNLLRGDIKLVGVRPISEYYFSLYPTEAQSIRLKHKPGLIPPFYADLPGTFDEIVTSEVSYLRSFENAPLRTDFVYLMKILKNIIFKKVRSK